MSEHTTTSRADGQRQETAIALVGGPSQMRSLATGEKMEHSFKEMNPKGYLRVRQSFMLACVKNPKLYNCTLVSATDALCKAVAYNLETDGVMGRAYLIPRWNTYLRCEEMHFQLGYKGLAEFFYRANAGGLVDGGFACEGDTFDYRLGTESFVHMIKAKERGEITHFWAYYTLASGRTASHVMTVEEMLDHCSEYRSDKAKVKSNKLYQGLWDIRFDQMGVKTCVGQLLKRAPMSAEGQAAVTEDEYRATGQYGIVDRDGVTSLELIEDEKPEAAAAAPTNGEPAKRMRMGSKKTPAEAAPESPPTAPAAPVAAAGAHIPLTPAEKATVNLADARPAQQAYQEAPALPTVEWHTMTAAEIFECWNALPKEERTARWKAMDQETQNKVAQANQQFTAPPPAPPAAPAREPAPKNDALREKAKAYIAALGGPDAHLAWVSANRFTVPSEVRAPMSAACGLDTKLLLNQQPINKVAALAEALCYWLLLHEKNMVLPAKPAGRPAAR